MRSPTAGLPRGRPTLICGGAGLRQDALRHGIPRQWRACEFGEPGVFMAFEETARGARAKRRARSASISTAPRRSRKNSSSTTCISSAARSRRPANTTSKGSSSASATPSTPSAPSASCSTRIETLFGGFSNEAILRAELRRLFRWLKDKGVTAVITGERGDGALTRQGLEEYVSDCVILLDHRVHDQISTRRLRVVKYRGTPHGTNEYPFLIDEDGITVLPITSLGLTHEASDERISTGIPASRRHARRQGLSTAASTCSFRAPPARAKPASPRTSPQAACERGERCLYFAFEESPQQILRNMRSIGIDLRPVGHAAACCISSPRGRPLYGLEMHLATMHKVIRDYSPRVVVVDPISNFFSIADGDGGPGHAHAPGRLPQAPADHGPADQPHRRRPTRWKRPTSASRR